MWREEGSSADRARTWERLHAPRRTTVLNPTVPTNETDEKTVEPLRCQSTTAVIFFMASTSG